ncbi:hypothetical protein OAK17_06155 [Alphaproteobacteria bacterium]|nr:hypothetical protein [Alphaproteobacteria bacterium]
MKIKPFAIIDVGSNTVRLVIYNSICRSPLIIYNERTKCELGKGLFFTKKLNPESIIKANFVIKRFVFLSREMDAEICIVATAAIRDAKDGEEFVKSLTKEIGVDITILSGKEEAELSARGVLSYFSETDGLIGDLGGGSLELINSKNNNLINTVTLPYGTLRYGSEIELNNEFINNLANSINKLEWLELINNRTFFAVGGSWRALAKLHIEMSNYSVPVVQNYTIQFEECLKLCKFLSRLSKSSLDKIKIISKQRLKNIPFSALVMENILLKAKPSKIIFSTYALREGLVFQKLTEKEKSKESLESSVITIMKYENISYEGYEEIYNWIEPIIKDYPEKEKRLIKALIIVSDIAFKVHKNFKGEYAYKKILFSQIRGVDHFELSYLAISLCSRYRGDSIIYKSNNLLQPQEIKRANIIGSAIDLVKVLNCGNYKNLTFFKLSIKNNLLIINVKKEKKYLINSVVEKRVRNLCYFLKYNHRIN